MTKEQIQTIARMYASSIIWDISNSMELADPRVSLEDAKAISRELRKVSAFVLRKHKPISSLPRILNYVLEGKED